MVGRAKRVRQITLGWMIQLVVEDAGFIRIGIPHVGSADKGKEVRAPEGIVEATGFPVEDECVRIGTAQSCDQVDVTPSFEGPNRVLHRIGVQISSHEYGRVVGRRGVLFQPPDKGCGSARPCPIAFTLSIAPVRIANRIAIRALGFEMVCHDGQGLARGVGLEGLSQTGTVAILIEIRVRSRVEYCGRPDRCDRVAAVDDSDRDRVAARTGRFRMDGRVGSARCAIVQRLDQLAEGALWSRSVVFDLDERDDSRIEPDQGLYQFRTLAFELCDAARPARRESSAATVAIHVVLDVPCDKAQSASNVWRLRGSGATDVDADGFGRLNPEASKAKVEDAFDTGQGVSQTQSAAVVPIQIRNWFWSESIAPVVEQDASSSVEFLKF